MTQMRKAFEIFVEKWENACDKFPLCFHPFEDNFCNFGEILFVIYKSFQFWETFVIFGKSKHFTKQKCRQVQA